MSIGVPSATNINDITARVPQHACHGVDLPYFYCVNRDLVLSNVGARWGLAPSLLHFL